MRITIEISDDEYRKIQDGRASVVMMRDAIRNGIPLEQEPKTGRWIEKADEYYRAINEKAVGLLIQHHISLMI